MLMQKACGCSGLEKIEKLFEENFDGVATELAKRILEG